MLSRSFTTCTGLCFIALWLFFAACSAAKQAPNPTAQAPKMTQKGKKLAREVKHSRVFAQSHTGFTLMDATTGRILSDVQGDHYFTPASNTKILTLYASLKYLGDSLPGIQYQIAPNGALLLRGTGDPTILNPFFEAWQGPFQFLTRNKGMTIKWTNTNVSDAPLGPGWAWDDADEDYSPERSAFTIYGNLLQTRSEKDTVFKPIHEVATKWAYLLTDTLNPAQPIGFQSDIPSSPWKNIRSTPIDTVLRLMMQESDNFLAEQLIWMIGGQVLDTLGTAKTIKMIQEKQFKNLPIPLKWVDGSGLSRYNLATPRSIAAVLHRLWQEQPQERLLSIFPAGGVSGTIAKWYAGPDGKPYVFAKTGTLSGVHCLSGYLRTRKGKWLIFSFMHNHYLSGSQAWRQEMQRFLAQIAEKG